MTTARRLWWAAAAAAAAFLVVLILVETNAWVTRTDRIIERHAVHFYFAHYSTNVWIQRATRLGDPRVLAAVVALAGVVLLHRHRARAAIFVAVVAASGGLVNRIAKTVIGRQRPGSIRGFVVAHGAGFPSGHAMGATVVFGAVLFVLWPGLPRASRVVATSAAAAMVVVVAMSRVYLGAHYPTDVVAGVFLGTAWVLTCGTVWISRSKGTTSRMSRGSARG